MVRRTGPSPDQEALLIAAPRSGQLQERDFSAPDPEQGIAVPIIERNIHLQNVLGIFSTINSRAAFVQTPGVAEKAYSQEAATEVLEHASDNLEDLKATAQAEFRRAFGFYAIRASGLGEKDVITNWADTAFETFKSEFGWPHQLLERTRVAKELKDRTADMQLDQTKRNRAAKVAERKQRRKLPPTERKELELSEELNTRQRLQAMHQDVRDGSLPTTHSEKNKKLAYLSYMDEPNYPLGINNQFFEVFIHNQTMNGPMAGIETSVEAMVSIPHEIADHLENAIVSLGHLRALSTLVDETPNPKLGLIEETTIGSSHPGFAPLIRYRDLAAYRDRGVEPVGIRDILQTKEDRRPHFERDKNKTLEDVYTRRRMDPEMSAYISAQIGGMTIGQSRSLIEAAITDQELRRDFMIKRLLEFRRAPGSPYLPMWSVAQKRLKRLGIEIPVK
jgi:hypothetical protein